ncbi:DUF6174 domain-containing protein [Streptomyces bottropensis]|uniref:DUF6174 domain-containing protein n=1 Tax=Streptomyces bottropensis TaxID=42235 RepID=UPI0036CA6CE7
MTLVRLRARSVLLAAVLAAGTVGLTTACEGGTASPRATGGASREGTTAQNRVVWQDPASYTYTLTSSSQVLTGRFRVTVRGGEVTEAVGLDADSRRAVALGPGAVPTIGDLIDSLENAWQEGADTAEAEYAPDGHPSRITLDPDENAIDDEAEYAITAYEPDDG